MIEEYMNNSCYNWNKYAEFNKGGLRHVVISEIDPNGEESELYILHEDKSIGKVYNCYEEVVYSDGLRG